MNGLGYWLRWRPTDPISWAALGSAVLILIGLSFAIIGPLAAGPPRADSAPITAASPGAPGSIAPTASAEPTNADTDPSPDPTTGRTGQQAGQLISLINQARTQAGCDKLHSDGHLRASARAHSTDMAGTGTVSRTGSDGSSPADRMRQAGYHKPKGEAVGSGYSDAQAAYDDWQAEPQQNELLTDCDAKAVGVSIVAASDGTTYWTADFGA